MKAGKPRRQRTLLLSLVTLASSLRPYALNLPFHRQKVLFKPPYRDNVLTITADNGREFARHAKISKSLKADFYFAHPYHAWERGLNENTNGLLRQYFPKNSDFRKIDDQSIDHAMGRLNNRPRKTLGFATPNDVFLKDINNKDPVALVV